MRANIKNTTTVFAFNNLIFIYLIVEMEEIVEVFTNYMQCKILNSIEKPFKSTLFSIKWCFLNIRFIK